MPNPTPVVRLLNKSLGSAQAELGKAVPEGWEWAKPALEKMAAEHKQVRAHVPEVLDVFHCQNGEFIIADGGINTWLKSKGGATLPHYDKALAGALPYHNEAEMRANALIIHHANYPAVADNNTLAHELGHFGDVCRGFNDELHPVLVPVSSPKMGQHSGSSLFKLCHDLDEALYPQGMAAKRTKGITVCYAPKNWAEEKFAEVVGDHANQHHASPLSGHYVRKIFRPDMALKAEKQEAVRIHLEHNGLMAPYPKVVGEELEPLFDRWRDATQELERYKAQPQQNDLELRRLRMRLDTVLDDMRKPEMTDKIRKTVSQFLDNAVPQAEEVQARFERQTTGPKRR